MKKIFIIILLALFNTAFSSELKVAENAPLFKLVTHENKSFDLSARKGMWTVLYFYPKAETPGCTTQACAFRDQIKKIRQLNADVYGISTDSVANQAAFHKNHQLNFTLLADEKAEVVNLYGSKIPLLSMSKRWTFIIDPNLKIKSIDRDVDPVLNAEKVAAKIAEFQHQAK